jgi:hypothetical protein
MDWLYFRQLPGGNGYEDEDDSSESHQCVYYEGQCRRSPGRVYKPFSHVSDDEHTELEECIARTTPNYELYVLADRYNVPTLRRSVLDWKYYLYARSDATPWNTDYIYLLRNLPITSPLLKLMIHVHVDQYKPSTDMAMCGTETLLRQELNLEFFAAVVDGHSTLKHGESKQAVK